MQSSLSAARDKKTDFTPRTGGNRYRVLDPAQPQGGGEAAKVGKVAKASLASAPGEEAAAVMENGIEGEDAGLTKEVKSKTTKGTKPISSTTSAAGSLDFLLARALQTTSTQHHR
jgi:hypothetical protein